MKRCDPGPPWEALALSTRVHWRGLLYGALPALGYLGFIAGLLQVTAEPGAQSTVFASLWQLHALYMFALIVFEEVLMRGFLLGQLIRFTTSFRAQTWVAVLFVGMHLPSWIVFQGLHWGLLPSAVVVLLQGIVLGIVARSSRSILPAIAIHFANNILADVMGGS